MNRIYLLSLGCPRNLVDSEILAGHLENAGFEMVDDLWDADIGIVNTCGFIQEAKEEAINIILRLTDLKKEKKIKKLIVCGCLAQRYPSELLTEIKEIDAVFGTSDILKIPQKILTVGSGKKLKEVTAIPSFLYDHSHTRKRLTPAHYAYVKIQEGCSNRCSYCVIPDLRGPLRSRDIGSLEKEIEALTIDKNLKELILIGQDTTSFGLDRKENSELSDLLEKVSFFMKQGWVRVLYTHPAHFTEKLIDVFAETDNICKYIDLPIQHINTRILNRMNRNIGRDEISSLITRLRQKIKGVVLRTSVIVGFPGETESDFNELLDFLMEVRFDRLGAFIYSKEEETRAAGFKDQVSFGTKKKRFDEIMKLQQEISYENNLGFIEKKLKVLIEDTVPDDPFCFTGRSEMDAPEVDGMVYVKGKNLRIGSFVETKISGIMEYDLIGEAV
ncbi:MAG: 30S ribosomal protein S12 methylthiotransferase RimO [Candidatus Omnitrophota bacterium]